MQYTPEEDAAIENYIHLNALKDKYFTVGGVLIWKQMENEQVDLFKFKFLYFRLQNIVGNQWNNDICIFYYLILNLNYVFLEFYLF